MTNYLDDKSFVRGLVIIVILLLLYPYSNSLNSLTKIFQTKKLYLKDRASIYVRDMDDFEKKVRSISRKLEVHPDWLMAIMHSESKLDASLINYKGSGATGLIQFLPSTAQTMKVTVEQLRNLNHIQQLDYVYQYLNEVKKIRKVKFNSITDLYLAVLYPAAIGKDASFVLYKKPSSTYKNNSGLDEDRDGKVSIGDVDLRMKRLYPIAYQSKKGFFLQFSFAFYFLLFLGIVFLMRKHLPLRQLQLKFMYSYKRLSQVLRLRLPK